jgi:hypothetical protein
MAKATRVISTPPTESKISRQLGEVGLRLERAPPHLPDGYRIYYGRQILAGNSFGLTLTQVGEFIRRCDLDIR